jgi:hypothetical protein
MAMVTNEIKGGKLPPGAVVMTVKVNVRELRIRMAIGIWLIKLGARVIGLGVEIEPLENHGTGSGTQSEGDFKPS